jgi:inner membrane protein
MDNLTHSLTGLMLSRAGLNRWSPRPDLVLILAANVPDIDIVALISGPLHYFEWHRGLTHSFAMLPVMALLPVAVVCAINRSMHGWRSLYVLSMLGVLSHLLLDLTNAYGVRVLLPFSTDWLHFDLNSLTDVWILAALMLAVIGPWLGRLVSSEMGAKPGSGRGLAMFALCFLLAFDFGRFLIHERVLATLNERLYNGSPPRRVAAFPTSVNPLLWIGWVDGANFSTRYVANLSNEFDPSSGLTFLAPEPAPAIAAARQTEPFQVFLRFAQYPVWSVTPASDPEGASEVDLRDGRFGFGANAVVDRSTRVVRAVFHY